MLLDPLDLYGIANALTEEERMVQNVARLVSEKVLPTIHKCFEEQHLPRELIPELAVVWAVTGEGIRGCIIEKGTPGFSAPGIERKFSQRASVASTLFRRRARA